MKDKVLVEDLPAGSLNGDISILSVENLIHVIRGQQVILDSDLAKLYGVETRRLNEQVKRNIERFPEDFMFQLTKEETENLMSQFATSSFKTRKNGWGGVRKCPYAFTEQGIAMLSSVLKSSAAIEVNIRIMRAFTAMRSFMLNNAQIFHRLEAVEYNLLLMQENLSLTDRKLEQVLSRLEKKELDPIEGFFFEGQIFDAFTLISDLVRSAQTHPIAIR